MLHHSGGSRYTTVTAMEIESVLTPGYAKREGIYYFSEVPGDMIPVHGKKRTFFGKANRAFFADAFSKITGGVVADIGAGPSYFDDILSRFTAIPVDLFPYKGIKVIADFNKNLPFKNESLDAILLSNVLEHIAEPAILISECRRVLKKGGVLVGAVPFMLPLHQTPYDFYRFTEFALVYQFRNFSETSVVPVAEYYQLYKAASGRFFNSAATTLPMRVVWFLMRILLSVTGFFSRDLQNRDEPIGYHFLCKK